MATFQLHLMGAAYSGDDIDDCWQTPRLILDAVDDFLGEWFDPCPANPTFDGTSIDWESRKAFINPPFSKWADWCKKARSGSEHIWLGHHNHDAGWFKTLLMETSAICLLYKRVIFIDPRTGLPRINANNQPQTTPGKCQSLLYTGKRVSEFKQCFEHLGKVLETL